MKNLLIVLALILSVNVFGQKSKTLVSREEIKSNGQISELKVFDMFEISQIFEKADELANRYELNSTTDIEQFLKVIDTNDKTYVFNYIYSSSRKYSYIRITNTDDKVVILIFRYNSTFTDNFLISKNQIR